MLKKTMQKFLPMNLFMKLMVMLLVTSILPIYLTQLITYSISTATIRKQTMELGLANLQQSASGMEDFFRVCDKIILDIYTDDSYTASLKSINLWDTRTYNAAKRDIVKKLESIVYVNPEILGIAIVGLTGDATFYDTVTRSGQESFCFEPDRLRMDPVFRDSLKERHALYSDTFGKSDARYGSRQFFYVAHQMTDFNNYENGPIGSILLCVDETAVRDVYMAGMDPKSNWTFLVNGQGDIVSFPESAHVGANLFADGSGESLESAAVRFFQQNRLMDSDQLEVHVVPIMDGEFSLVHVQNLTYALRDIKKMTVLIVFIGLLVGAVCVLISMTFAGGTNKTVKKIIQAMGKADRGDYDVRLALKGQDEFARIAHHFNDMIARIQESRVQERDALVREKNAEIRSLEAQINPHFLCNTLDAINWVAIEREELHISKLLNHLAVILRHSIYRSNESVTLREELEYLKRYIFLQQERFCHSFGYSVEIDEELQGCRIHKLLIQPLIENTIIHGFPGLTGRDEIQVVIRRRRGDSLDQVSIQVRDNGKGMSGDLVERFNHYDHQTEDGRTHIGVRNVITRLMLYYGSGGGFHVESGEAGTCVTMWIPWAA